MTTQWDKQFIVVRIAELMFAVTLGFTVWTLDLPPVISILVVIVAGACMVRLPPEARHAIGSLVGSLMTYLLTVHAPCEDSFNRAIKAPFRELLINATIMVWFSLLVIWCYNVRYNKY